jgi:hypothetical protein
LASMSPHYIPSPFVVQSMSQFDWWVCVHSRCDVCLCTCVRVRVVKLVGFFSQEDWFSYIMTQELSSTFFTGLPRIRVR